MRKALAWPPPVPLTGCRTSSPNWERDMAFGDGTADESLRDAWQHFCDRLRSAGDLVFKDANPATPLHRADAMRFLTQNLGQAFVLALETRDPAFPQIHQLYTPNRKLRPEERRVGRGGVSTFRYRLSPYNYKKKKH